MLKYTLDQAAYDALDPTLKEHYAKDEHEDGVFNAVLELPQGYGVENVTGLKSSLAKERTNYKAEVRARKALEEQLAAGDDNALKTELETLRAETKARDARIAELVAGSQMKDAVTKLRGNQHVLLPVLRTMTKVEGDTVVVLDDKGKPREGVTVEDLVSELRERDEYAGAFAGLGNSGGSTPPNGHSGGRSSTLTLKRSTMTISEKAAYCGEHGTEKFMELPWA